MSADVRAYWRAKVELARVHAQACEVQETPVDLGNRFARYTELTSTGLDGSTLMARVVRPSAAGAHPVLLMFHDATRGVRGWHHMTRFVALGYAVVALENRAGVEGVLVEEPLAVGDGLGVTMRVMGSEPLRLGRSLTPQVAEVLEETLGDALVLACLLPRLDGLDVRHTVCWGEGLGGALALATAALSGARACCALNPLPAALDNACAQLDVARIVQGYEGAVLLGTGMLDLQAPPEAQGAISAGLAHVRQLRYPRYAHERVNAYEDEMMAFLVGLEQDKP